MGLLAVNSQIVFADICISPGLGENWQLVVVFLSAFLASSVPLWKGQLSGLFICLFIYLIFLQLKKFFS